MLELSEVDKLAILAGSVGLFGIVTTLTMCFVCPACCVYKRLQRSNKIQQRNSWQHREELCIGGQFKNAKTYNFQDPPPPYEQWQASAPPMELMRLQSTSSCSSGCSSGSYVSTITELDSMRDDSFVGSIKEQRHGFVIIGFSYLPCTDVPRGQLTVTIKEAHDLPIRPYGTRCHPYFVVELMKSKSHRLRPYKKLQTINRFVTTVIQKSVDPIFNESHTMAIMQKDLTKGSLKVVAWDKEKWANDTALGEARIPLRELSAILGDDPTLEQTIELQLKEPKTSNGEILIGLCYLPTSERIVLAILKINNLKMEKEIGLQSAYVQAMAVYSGKVMEKRKTSARPSSSFQVFNEMLMFDVPSSKLDRVVLMVVVKVQNSSVEKEDAPTNDVCMGKALIGSLCKKNGIHHWTAMRNAPRRQIIQWHDLV